VFPSIQFHPLTVIEECRSSQEILLNQRGQPGFHGSAVLARRQTAGFGRRGRAWSSGEGNLALSIGLEIPRNQHLSLLPFVVGIGLARAAAAFLLPGADLRLKWPNDLYLDGKKLAGMISQVRQFADCSEVVLGIGLNLAKAPEGLEAIAISHYGQLPDPEFFATTLLRELERVFGEAVDCAWVRAQWERAARLQEDMVYVLGEESAQPLIPLALLCTGELLVRCAKGLERRLSSEEVSLRFAPALNSAPSP